MSEIRVEGWFRLNRPRRVLAESRPVWASITWGWLGWRIGSDVEDGEFPINWLSEIFATSGQDRAHKDAHWRLRPRGLPRAWWVCVVKDRVCVRSSSQQGADAGRNLRTVRSFRQCSLLSPSLKGVWALAVSGRAKNLGAYPELPGLLEV